MQLIDSIAKKEGNSDLISKLYNVSSDETVVGKWIDGRNIYRKCISFGQIQGVSSMSKAHGIENMDMAIHIYGSAVDTTLESRYAIPLPFVSTKIENCINVGVGNENVVLYFSKDQSRYNASVIIEYIKISDI